MRKAFFYYSQIPSGKWVPVIRFDEPPVISNGYEKSSNGLLQPATGLVELTEDDYILTEPENFSELMKRYPRNETK